MKKEQQYDDMPTIEAIVKQWLKSEGYTGLQNEDLSCHCEWRHKDSFMACGEPVCYECRAR